MGFLERVTNFVDRITESSAASRLTPGQRIQLKRDYRADVRPRDRDDGEGADPSVDQSESRRKMLRDIMTIDMDRKRRLKTYEEMDKSDIAASSVDMYAEDATQINPDTGRTVWIESDSEAIRDAGEDMLENLQIEEEIMSLARNTALYGESFERLIYEPTLGVRAFFHTPAGDLRREEDRYRVLMGFSQEGLKYVRDNIHGRKLSEPWDFIHFRLWRHRTNPYGISILHNAIRPWRQIILGEDQALMYRLMRAPDRFAFFIDVGDQGEIDAWQSLHRFRRRHKKYEFQDPVSGRYDYRFNPITPLEDMYFAVHGKDSGTRVEKLFGSPNSNDVTDLLFYIRKFCAAVRIPPEFLGFNYPEQKSASSYDSKSSLTQQSKRYANAVAKLQQAIREGIRHALEVHLRLKAPDPEDTTYDFDRPGQSFRVMMQPVSQLDDMDRLDAEHVRATLAQSMLQMGVEDPNVDLYNWTMYVLKKVYRMSDVEINKLVSKDGMKPYASRDGNVKGDEEEKLQAVIQKAKVRLESIAARKNRSDGKSLKNILPNQITTSVTEEDLEEELKAIAASHE